jgi:hypothetical protein
MIAMAMRGGGGFKEEDFDLVFIFGAFAMLSQYTANSAPDIVEPRRGQLI